MKRIAMGVLTKNHAKVVYSVLSYMAPILMDFAEFGLDVYYLDASDGNDTEVVVKAFMEGGCTNLHYKRVAADTPVSARTRMLFLNEDLEDTYDYYWPVKDRVAFDLPGLLNVYQAVCRLKYDLIVLDGYGAQLGVNISSREYERPEEFYRDFGWIVPSLDATLYRHTVIQSFDWSLLEGDSLLDTQAGSFLHFMVAFQGMPKLPKSKAYVIHEPNTQILCDRGTSSAWIKDTFRIWKKFWVEVNDSLPSVYDPYKEKVIRGHALPAPFRSEAGMRELKQRGALTPENIDFVLDGLERVSDVPKELVRRIALEI